YLDTEVSGCRSPLIQGLRRVEIIWHDDHFCSAIEGIAIGCNVFHAYTARSIAWWLAPQIGGCRISCNVAMALIGLIIERIFCQHGIGGIKIDAIDGDFPVAFRNSGA